MEDAKLPHYPKGERIERELAAELRAGRYGAPGSPFLTTRELMELKQISVRTAHRILSRLCAAGLLEVRGRRYYRPERSAAPARPVIGVLLTCFDNPYFASLAAHLERLIGERGGEVRFALTCSSAERERSALAGFVADGVAGIISSPWEVRKNETVYRRLPVPWVLIGRTLRSEAADAVLVDNDRAARSVAFHLIDRGCRLFCYVGLSCLAEDSRLSGFRRGLLERGVPFPAGSAILLDGEQPDFDALRTVMRSRRGKLGIFCYQDLLAARTVAIAHELGLRIPEECAVVGFDDLPVAAELYPPLTTVHYPVRNMAATAVEILFSRLGAPSAEPGFSRYVESRLIVRASTDPEAEPSGIRLPNPEF